MDPAKRPASQELLLHPYIYPVRMPQFMQKDSVPPLVGSSIDSQHVASVRQKTRGVSLVPVPLANQQRSLLARGEPTPRANSQSLTLAAQSSTIKPIAVTSSPSKRPLVEAKLRGSATSTKSQLPSSKSKSSKPTTMVDSQKVHQPRRRQPLGDVKVDIGSKPATGSPCARRKYPNALGSNEVTSNATNATVNSNEHKSLLPILQATERNRLFDRPEATGNSPVTNKLASKQNIPAGYPGINGSNHSSSSSSVGLLDSSLPNQQDGVQESKNSPSKTVPLKQPGDFTGSSESATGLHKSEVQSTKDLSNESVIGFKKLPAITLANSIEQKATTDGHLRRFNGRAISILAKQRNKKSELAETAQYPLELDQSTLP